MSCDDGDLIAYSTDVIHRFIDLKEQLQWWRQQQEHTGHINRHPDSQLEETIDNTPRPLLHKNVGRSAWGLAVHEEARLIAVSANSHVITVFALALTHEVLEESRDCGSDDESFGDDEGNEQRQRRSIG